MKILINEPDNTTRDSLEVLLSSDFFVFAVDNCEDTLDILDSAHYDLLVTENSYGGDVMINELRKKKNNIPVLILSTKGDAESKLRGFGFGADDYMTKPFHREELVARIAAIIRRSKGHSHSVIQTGALVVNLDVRSVEVHGKPVILTDKEYQILELLSMHKGTTLTKEMFLNHLYGGMDEPELRIIDVFICKLRKKLESVFPTSGQLIQTVWGKGHKLEETQQ